MNCCSCTATSLEPRTRQSTAKGVGTKIVSLVAVLGLITTLTPLPQAIGGVLSDWGIVLPWALSWVVAMIAMVVAFFGGIALLAAGLAGLLYLAIRNDPGACLDSFRAR